MLAMGSVMVWRHQGDDDPCRHAASGDRDDESPRPGKPSASRRISPVDLSLYVVPPANREPEWSQSVPSKLQRASVTGEKVPRCRVRWRRLAGKNAALPCVTGGQSSRCS